MFVAIISFNTNSTSPLIKLSFQIISENRFSEILHFDIPTTENHFLSNDIIVIEKIINDSPVNIIKFENQTHVNLLNPDNFKNNPLKLNVFKHKKIARFIIDNQLDDFNKETALLNFLHKLIKNRTPIPFNTIEKVNNEYEIYYSQSGYDKPGDWSVATLSIQTNNNVFYNILSNSNTPFKYTDEYLSMLYPTYNVTLLKGYDDDVCLFKSQIIERLRSEFDINKLIEVEDMCKIITKNIKNMAMLIYDKKTHLEYINKSYSKLRSELLLQLKAFYD